MLDEQEYARAKANYQSILSETFEEQQERWDAPPGGRSSTRVLYGQNKYSPFSTSGISSSGQGLASGHGHILRPSPHPYYDPSVGPNSSMGSSLLHNKGNMEKDREILSDGGMRAQAANDLGRYIFARGMLREGDRIDVTRSAPTLTIGSGNDFDFSYKQNIPYSISIVSSIVSDLTQLYHTLPSFLINTDRISATRSLRETVDLSNMTYQRMKDITGHY